MSKGGTETPWHGQLSIFVKEFRNLPIKGMGAYCVLQVDKQQIQTKAARVKKMTKTQETNGVIKESEFEFYDRLDETFFFDVTDPSSHLTISVYGGGSLEEDPQWLDNADGVLLGRLTIGIQSISHGKLVDQWFKLLSLSNQVVGEISVKLLFVHISKTVGVEDFEPLTIVGRGTFAKVMLVRKKDTKRLYAMKILRKDQVIKHNAVKHTMSEKNVLTRIKHPFIVSLKYSFQTDSKLYMILDYIGGGELFYHLSEAEKFPEYRAKFYASEILLALGYLHQHDIVYRDLKPENLLLDIDGHICITDFGLCKEGLSFGRLTHTFCGSPEYLAPEILLLSGYDKGVDWWALGTLLYEMIAGLPPYFSEDIDEMNHNILSAPLLFTDDFSKEAKSLLSALLTKDPKRRLGHGLRDAEEIKEHEFFKGIDWSKLENRAVEPPFRPHLKSETDVRFFDPETTAQRARLSVDQGSLTNQEQQLFEGFTYVAPELAYSPRRRGSSGTKHIHKPLLINEDHRSPPHKRDFLSNHRFENNQK